MLLTFLFKLTASCTYANATSLDPRDGLHKEFLGRVRMLWSNHIRHSSRTRGTAYHVKFSFLNPRVWGLRATNFWLASTGDVDPVGCGGLDLWKYVGGVRVRVDPLKCHIHSKRCRPAIVKGRYGTGLGFTHSHESVVRATTKVNGKTGNSTPCHAQTP